MTHIELIEHELMPLKDELTNHEVYHLLSDISDVQIFMETHIFAVWDFMSLLKALQNHLTCTTIPWKPRQNTTTARFINEIVFGEETDINENGEPRSHFEMYLEAMQEVGADTSKMLNMMSRIKDLSTIKTIIDNTDLKQAEKNFLHFTFDIIQTNEPHKIAAAFTFGREDLIPDMFIEIINQSGGSRQFTKLTYYLERHIEVDGDEHGPLSLAMIAELCGNDEQKWQDVLNIAKTALRHRINLWDEIATRIEAKKMVLAY